MSRALRSLIVLLPGLIAGPVATLALDPEHLRARLWSEPDAAARLERGEVVAVDETGDDGSGAVYAAVHISAPVEQVWAVIGDCEAVFRYVRGMEACELLEHSDRRAVVRQRVDKGWAAPQLDYTVEFLRSPPLRIDFRQLEGDLEIMQGSWRFEPLADGAAVRVTHDVQVKPKMPAPAWLTRRSLRKDVPDMLACVRYLAGGSGGDAQAAADQEACARKRRR